MVRSGAEELLGLAPAEAVARSNVARVLREGLVTSRPVNRGARPHDDPRLHLLHVHGVRDSTT